MSASLSRGRERGKPKRVGGSGPLGSIVHGARGLVQSDVAREVDLNVFEGPHSFGPWVIGIHGRVRDQVSRQAKW